MRWYVVNSLTSAILGRIQVNDWEITEPLREPSTGTLKVPLSDRAEDRAELKKLIRPAGLRSFDRAIALEIDDKILFYGPIVSRPVKDGPQVEISVVDWRSWFYACPIRPTGTKFVTRRNYTAFGAEQENIMLDLVRLALRNTLIGTTPVVGAPPIIIDTPPATGINRNLSAKMFQGESVGAWLDTIMKRHNGAEWYTYGVLSKDEMKVRPHFAVAWPERRQNAEPLRITWRQGGQGNAAGYTWRQRVIAPTRVWATDGGEVTKVWSQATYTGVTTGADLLWEMTVPLDDSKAKKKDAFALAKGTLKKQTGAEGDITVTVVAENLAFSSYSVGDRVRLRLVDDWESVDTDASRITQRVLSGGAGEATQQVLTIDITDDQYPDEGDPGSVVT